jgi:TonB family protein
MQSQEIDMRSQIVSALAVLTLFACTNTATPAASASGDTTAASAASAPPPPPPRHGPIHGSVARDVVAPPAEYADVPVYEPHAPMTEPAVIKRVDPPVPAGLAGQTPASVTVEAVIDTDGHVPAAWVVDGDQRFATAATAAVKQWQFRPATVDGKPVRLRYRVTIAFG